MTATVTKILIRVIVDLTQTQEIPVSTWMGMRMMSKSFTHRFCKRKTKQLPWRMLKTRDSISMIWLTKKWSSSFRFARDFTAPRSRQLLLRWSILGPQPNQRCSFLIWMRQCYKPNSFNLMRKRRPMMVTSSSLYSLKVLGLQMWLEDKKEALWGYLSS